MNSIVPAFEDHTLGGSGKGVKRMTGGGKWWNGHSSQVESALVQGTFWVDADS